MEEHMRGRLGFALATVAALALSSACSSGDRQSSADSVVSDNASGSGAAASADLGALRAKIDSYMAVPKWLAPGASLDASKLKGKTIFNIPDSSANPFTTGVAAAEQRAAEKLQINFINCTNQGQVTEWVSCYNQAIQRKVDIINNWGGVDPRQLGPQIAAAREAGIEVVAHAVYGTSQQPAGIKHSVPLPHEQAGQLLGEWVSLDTQRNADVLMIVANEVLATQPIVENFKRVFAQECPSCKLTIVNVPVKDWSTKIQSEVQSAIVRDPKLNYVVPIYDSMTQFVTPAVRATNKVGKVHVATFNGTPFVLKEIQNGDIVRMDIGVNLEWIGYAYLDSDLRLLAGEKLPAIFDPKLPLRIFKKENVDEAGDPPTQSAGYGSDYVPGFEKLWGVS